MKKAWKNVLTTGAIVLGGLTIGIGVFFAITLIQKPKITDTKNAFILKRDYKQNNNFNLIEFPYKPNWADEEKFFLGEKGLAKLNQTLNERLPFASEVDQLKYIAFNNQKSLPGPGQVNGQYNPYTMELDIDTRYFIDNGNYLKDDTTEAQLNERVEFVFATILHEYGHHLANSYITAVKPNDARSYNSKNSGKEILVPSNQPNMFIYKNISEQFMNSWQDALNYDKDKFSQLEKNQANDSAKDILYSKYSSKEIFDAANHGLTNDFQRLSNSPEEFQTLLPSTDGKIQSFSPKLANLVKYSYGVDELFTRHLVSLNYIQPQQITLNSNWDSYTPDIILRNKMSLDQNKQLKWEDNQRIFAVDNIFGGLLKSSNQQADTSSQTIANNSEKLLKTYREAMGYGKLISQIYFNNENNRLGINESHISRNDFEQIKIGGFVKKDSNIKGLIINYDKDKKILVEFENIFQGVNLHAKNSPEAKTYTENNNEYYSYISKPINLSKLDLSKIDSITAWQDSNNDQNLDDNESILINKGQVVDSRPINTFREVLKQRVRTYAGVNVALPDQVFYLNGTLRGASIYELNFSDQDQKLKFIKSIN